MEELEFRTSVIDSLARVETSLSEFKTNTNRRLLAIEDDLEGNGQPGVKERVTELKTEVAHLQTQNHRRSAGMGAAGAAVAVVFAGLARWLGV